jgi:hypothetical protein
MKPSWSDLHFDLKLLCLRYIDLTDLENLSRTSHGAKGVMCRSLREIIERWQFWPLDQLVILVRILTRYDPNPLTIGPLKFLDELFQIDTISEQQVHEILGILNHYRKTAVLQRIGCVAGSGSFATIWERFERPKLTLAKVTVSNLSLQAGEFCDAEDYQDSWYIAQILCVREDGAVLVHFVCFTHSHDEWIGSVDVKRKILRRGTRKENRKNYGDCECKCCRLRLVDNIA